MVDAGRNTVQLRFYEELNDHLPLSRRKRTFEYSLEQEERSIKNILDSLEIPLHEIDLVLVNDHPVDFEYKVHSRDRVAVFPVFESFDISPITVLGDRPLRKTTFIVPPHLGHLARLLILLGFDTLYLKNGNHQALLRRAEGEARIVVTTKKHPPVGRKAQRYFTLQTRTAEEQAKEILVRFQLQDCIKPFTRCMMCNVPLLTIEPHRTHCASCGRDYWPGSHYRKMRETVEKIVDAVGL